MASSKELNRRLQTAESRLFRAGRPSWAREVSRRWYDWYGRRLRRLTLLGRSE